MRTNATWAKIAIERGSRRAEAKVGERKDATTDVSQSQSCGRNVLHGTPPPVPGEPIGAQEARSPERAFEDHPGLAAALANLTSCQTTTPHGLLRRARVPLAIWCTATREFQAALCLDRSLGASAVLGRIICRARMKASVARDSNAQCGLEWRRHAFFGLHRPMRRRLIATVPPVPVPLQMQEGGARGAQAA